MMMYDETECVIKSLNISRYYRGALLKGIRATLKSEVRVLGVPAQTRTRYLWITSQAGWHGDEL
jgi:hypothetical protein